MIKKLVSVIALLALYAAASFSDARDDKGAFADVSLQFANGTDPAAVLLSAQSFLQQYPESPFALRVNYIAGLCLSDTPAAQMYFNRIVHTYGARTKFGALDMGADNRALAISAAYKIAQVNYARHKYAEASKAFSSLLSRFPGSYLSGEAQFGQTQVQLAEGQWSDAEETLAKLMQSDPYYRKDQRALYASGLLLFKKNDFEKAYDKLQFVSSEEGIYYQAVCLTRLNKYLPAVTILRRLLAEYPTTRLQEDARHLIADCYYHAADYDVALAEYTAFLSDFPHSALAQRALYQKGFSYIRKNEFNAGIDILKDVIRRYPSGEYAPLAQSLIAQALTEQRRYDAAISAYTVLITSYPVSATVPEGFYKLGWCYFNQNKYQTSIDKCRQMVRLYPAHELVPDALFLIAENYRRMADLDDAVVCYEQIVRSPAATPEKIESALFMLAKTYSEQKKYKEVVSTYHYIVNYFPAESSAWRPFTLLRIAEAYYYLGIFNDAENIYNTIIERYPFTHAANLAVEGKSWIYFQRKEYDLAKKERELLLDKIAVLSSSATKISSAYELGNISFNQKEYASALGYYESFIEQHPADPLVPDAYFNAGRCYYKMEYYTRAIAEWEKLIAGYPGNARSRDAVGIIADTYFRAQKYPEAIRAYQRAQTNYPGTELARESQLRIAQSYLNANDNLTAIAEFEKFIRLYGNDPLAATALDGIIMASYKLGQSSAGGEIDIQVMQRLLAKYPGTRFAASVEYRLAERYYEKKDYTRAAEVFKRAYSNSYIGENAPRALFFQAESLYLKGDYTEASAGFRRFIENYPQHEHIPLAYLHLANAQYHLKRYGEAGKLYVRLTHLTSIDEELATTALHNASICFRKLENWDQVVMVNKRFIELYPKSETINDVRIELAETYEALTQNDMARDVYRDMLTRLPAEDPLVPELRYRIAELYYKDGQADKAEAELQVLTSRQPQDDPWRLSAMAKRAQEYERARNLRAALDSYREILNSTRSAKWITAAEARIEALENQLQTQAGTNGN